MDFDSAAYWERRYSTGRNSGAGSYGRLAAFKARVLNDFIAEKSVASVIDFGCGDGNQLSLMRPLPYLGVDVSKRAVADLRARYAGEPLYRFVLRGELAAGERGDLALSLDVIYHLVEDAVYETYMRGLFDHAGRYVVIYSSNREARYAGSHIRHRAFGGWIARERPGWRALRHVPNPYPWDPADKAETSFADFHLYERG